MERNTKTTIEKLQIGDRFYKANDKNKEVWQKVDGKTKRTAWQTYKHHAKRDLDKYAVDLSAHTEVVFLRSTQQ